MSVDRARDGVLRQDPSETDNGPNRGETSRLFFAPRDQSPRARFSHVANRVDIGIGVSRGDRGADRDSAVTFCSPRQQFSTSGRTGAGPALCPGSPLSRAEARDRGARSAAVEARSAVLDVHLPRVGRPHELELSRLPALPAIAVARQPGAALGFGSLHRGSAAGTSGEPRRRAPARPRSAPCR